VCVVVLCVVLLCCVAFVFVLCCGCGVVCVCVCVCVFPNVLGILLKFILEELLFTIVNDCRVQVSMMIPTERTQRSGVLIITYDY
jgi:hypothetical protein